MMKNLMVLFCLIVYSSAVFAQQNWELVKDKNDIKVYTAKNPSSKFKEVKVEAVMAGTIPKLASVLRNVGGTKKWVYNTKNVYVIKKIGADELVYYTETSLPWPVKDRGVVLRMKMNSDAANKVMNVTSKAEPATAMAEKDGVVRLTDFDASWNVKSVGSQKISITYILKMDPAGSVPAGITNMFLAKGPWETFNNLSELIK